MKKNLYILLQIAFLTTLLSCKKDNDNSTPVVQTPIGVELLKNGNFEDVGKDWYLFYEPRDTVNPNKYTMEGSEEFAVSPKKSLKIKCDKVVDVSKYCQVNQTFSTTGIKTGAKLVLSAKIKAVNLAGTGVSIAIRGDKMNQPNVFFTTSQGKTPIVGDFNFKEFTLTLDAYAGNADFIIVFLVFLPQTTGTVYFDDVSLKAY